MLDRWFRLTAHGTTVRREMTAGLTTFAAMACLLAVLFLLDLLSR